jgi:2-iminobutanoate/2-iminopropanoate deaminase
MIVLPGSILQNFRLHALMSACSWSSRGVIMSLLKRTNYAKLPKPGGPYVHAVRHADTLYVSGLTAFATEAQGQAVQDQARAILEQLAAVAASEGTNLKSLIKITVFLTEIADLAAIRDVLFDYLDGALPASSLVAVSALFSPDLNVEIEAILAL